MKISDNKNWLDRINFLGMRIWDFGLRSLNREYSWLFLFKIIFKYPIRSIKGFWAYRKFSKSINKINPQKTYSNITPNELIRETENARSSLLVAMGYCQRPFRISDQPLQCPSERFSHNCYFVENFNRNSQMPPACSICEIKYVAELALKIGALFYVMTSAMDIARDIFIPALERQRFKYTIMFICPYSILPITLPLFICGIKFIIIPYATGDCCNYGEFVRADVGIKPKRTFPSRENFEFVLNILKSMGQNKKSG